MDQQTITKGTEKLRQLESDVARTLPSGLFGADSYQRGLWDGKAMVYRFTLDGDDETFKRVSARIQAWGK